MFWYMQEPAAPVKLNHPDEAIFLDRLRHILLSPAKVSNFKTNTFSFIDFLDWDIISSPQLSQSMLYVIVNH